MVVLGSNVDQIFCQVANQPGCDKAVVDIKFATPVAVYDTANNAFVSIFNPIFLQKSPNFLLCLIDRKQCLDFGLITIIPDP